MNYQEAALPDGAVKAGSILSMTEETVVPGFCRIEGAKTPNPTTLIYHEYPKARIRA